MSRMTRDDRRYRAGRTVYLEGTAAKELQYGLETGALPRRERQNDSSHQKRHAHRVRMNGLYVAFLAAAFVVLISTLTSYLEIQSSIKNHVDTLAKMETEYNDLKLSNDEEYNRISSSVDLEHVKAVAVGELGMIYANEGQIISIADGGTDYVRQSADLK